MLANGIDIHDKLIIISTSGLVAEYIVAIDVTRIRFLAGASFHLSLSLSLSPSPPLSVSLVPMSRKGNVHLKQSSKRTLRAQMTTSSSG